MKKWLRRGHGQEESKDGGLHKCNSVMHEEMLPLHLRQTDFAQEATHNCWIPANRMPVYSRVSPSPTEWISVSLGASPEKNLVSPSLFHN